MSPELAARVESAVTGRRVDARERASSARVVAIVRGLVLLVIVGVAAAIVIGRQRAARQLEADRAAILDSLHARGAGVNDEAKSAVTRDEAWLLGSAGAFEGELVDPSLRAPGAFAALLARPAIYVRGPIDSFTGSIGIARATKASTKDALLLCLIDPPSARSESALLVRVRTAYAGGLPFEQRTSNVRELAEAHEALRVLAPAWDQSVRRADDTQELSKLRTELERTPIEQGKQALLASVMIVAMDEPAPANGPPAELDGERPHDVRLVVVDLASASVVLRTRKHVDPSGWSVTSRSVYAGALDGCALAFDVRAGLLK